MKYIKLNTLNLKAHKVLNEQWIHDVIAADPSILGLGKIEIRDRERIQVGAGRLDLLFSDVEGSGRYEVEIQLGPTDPSHIIRTLEYWDIERKRYPQYEHTAVIVAEEITSRFLNVISLFNGSIRLVALQMRALEVGKDVALVFTKVVDAVQRGLVDEDEPVSTPVDRAYWQAKAEAKILKMIDEVLEMCKPFTGEIELSYNKHYIGFKVDGKAFNFAICKPQKSALLLELKLPQSEELDLAIEQSGIETLTYEKGYGNYRLRLAPQDLLDHLAFINALLKQAFDRKIAG